MLEALFYPQRVAVIGASRTPGKVGHDIFANLLTAGFTGEVVPINPGAGTILDRPAFPDLASYGQPVDLGVVAVPRPAVMEAMHDLARAHAKAVIVITAGFKETGPEGAELEQQLADFCRKRTIRLLGPNCLGLINTDNSMNASFAGIMPKPGGISVFSQSGALATSILDMADYRRMGLAKVVSIGNKADITEVDLLQALARDEQTRVIVGYLEDISSGDDFVKAAEEASSRKPVVILKAGTTVAGQRAASSHTGVLAGGEIAYGAAFKRSGVIRADTFEALFDYATLLSMQPLPKGNRILIITNAGGPGTMAADAVEQAGLEVATLDRNTATALREKLPAAASTGNPIDVLGDADPERYVTALTAAQDDEAVDAVMVILTPQTMTKPAETARAIIEHMTGDKPIVAVFMGGKGVMPGRTELVAAGLPDYYSPERGVSALKALCEYAAWRRRPPRMVTRFRVNRRRVERIISRSLRTGRNRLGEVKAKAVL
ncbi:MAG: CoA-binding protein, partial [Deltaproteobacteria bacterium]